MRHRVKSALETDVSIHTNTGLEYIQSKHLSQLATDEAVNISRAWLFEPLLVPDSELSQILEIEESTKCSAPLVSGSVCYFRSWTLYAWQLRQIVTDLMFKGFPDKDIRDWKLILQNFSNEAVITPRYVGTTTAPWNPWTRYHGRRERLNSLLGAFVDSLQYLFPEATKSHRIFMIKSTFVSDLSTVGPHNTIFSRKAFQLLSDQFERAMIGYFHPRTLLNRQPGGKRAVMAIETKDECVLHRCKTSLLPTLSQCLMTDDAAITERVTQLFRDWWDHVTQTIWSVEDHRTAELYKPYIDSTYRQAIFKQINGTSLAVLCGEEPPLRTILDGSTFFSGQRASGEFVKNILLSIARLEQENDEPLIDCLESLIGFNQLYNWPGLSRLQRGPPRVIIYFPSRFYHLYPLMLFCLRT